ncbi:MAG: diadenosine tetraphosphate hydrolase [Caulobacterales bacterium 32-69-10]|nr:MAG: diadenosine tetraphosphate hydrolase [Caulobacterales bacterium 32-69-10]
MAEFAIDPRLVAATHPLVSLKLSEARLYADARWPWILLVPRKVGARELEHLTTADRAVLMDEIVAAGMAVRAIGAASGRPVEKLNVGAIGNKVEQLHIHIAGRRPDDPAWPEPVWGFGTAKPYAEADLATVREAALTAFQGLKRK